MLEHNQGKGEIELEEEDLERDGLGLEKYKSRILE